MIESGVTDRGSSGSDDPARHHLWIATARKQFADARRSGRPAGFWPATGLPPHDSIPGYVIQSEIHRGGQGIVYRGIQASTGRAVAIKVLREGAFAGPTDRLRFEREVRVLGALQHPGVVTIHDYGAVDGSFYFTMEYIAGRPLDEYVRETSRPINAIVEVFARICDAVNAVHSLGIVHRDIKPRNILIAENGRPFVLDFGLAKAIADSDISSAQADMTIAGQFVGSLPWASPEQIRSNDAVVDTRTDVYSLGVVLYHALTGKFPYDLSGPPQQAIAAIQHAEPVPPRRHRREIPADIETILFKCLDKKPDRRYRTAGDLAADLRALLAYRPISARRDSLGYVLGKSIARHRTAFAAAAAVAILVTGSLIFSAIQWRRTADQRDLALVAKEQADAAKKAAAADAAKARATVEFLRTTLASANPNVTDEQDVKVSQVLQTAARELDSGSMKGQPEVEAISRLTLAEAFEAIGRSQEAERHIQISLSLLRSIHPGDHVDIARALLALSNIRIAQNDNPAAEEAARNALEMFRRIHQSDHEDVALALRHLASTVAQRNFATSVSLTREALAIYERVSGEQSEETANAKVSLARHLRHDSATRAESRKLLEEALAVFRKPDGIPRPSHADALYELGTLALFENDLIAAVQYLNESASVARQLFGENHQDVLGPLATLDYAYDRLGQHEKSLQVSRQAVEIVRNLHGPDSPAYFNHLRSVASALRRLGRIDESIAQYRDVLAGLVRLGHDKQIGGANTRIMLARLLLQNGGDATEAEQLARDALAIDGSILGDTHQMRTHARIELGDALVAQNRFREAEPVLLEAHARYQKLRLPIPTERLNGAQHLIKLYQAWDRAEPNAGHAEKATKWREWLTEAQEPQANGSAGR